MKVIWDSQNEEPLYAMNESALHAIVRSRREAEHRRSARCYGREIVVNAVVGSVMLACGGVLALADRTWLASLSWIQRPVTGWHVAAAATAGTIWLFCAWYMWTARRRQLQREERFDSTLHGELERALAHIDFQASLARSIVWWGLLPSWLAAGLGVVMLFHLKGAPASAYLFMCAMMIMAFALALGWARFGALRCSSRRRRELEILQAKLADSHQ